MREATANSIVKDRWDMAMGTQEMGGKGFFFWRDAIASFGDLLESQKQAQSSLCAFLAGV
jgi:hypothetical protein